MRIVYIHNIAMPGPEANTVNVAKMCAAFAANGCETILAALPGAPASQLESALHAYYGSARQFEVTPLPRACARPVAAAIAGVRLARARRADLLYTRAPHVALAACVAGIPTALEVHTDIDGFSSIGRAALSVAARQPNLRGLVVISEALRRRLHARIGASCARIHVAAGGADEREPATPPRNARFRAGFVGRFYRGKGVEFIARLAEQCPWADFELMGGDAEAARRIAGRPLAANLIAHGPSPHAAVSAFIDSCDVVLAPYQSAVIVADGRTDAAAWMSPLKIFEYMAAAKPILASDLPVLREVLAHRENALLAPPDDPQAWERALALLRDSEQLRLDLGAAARRDFLARYTWKRRAQGILETVAPARPRADSAAAAAAVS